MVLAGSAAEAAAIEDFQALLARVLAGETALTDDAPAFDLPAGGRSNGAGDAAGCRPAVRRQSRASAGYQPTIRDLPLAERPRERLREHGASYLNNAELVAILLRSGVSGENAISQALRIIAKFDGLGGLARAEYAEIRDQHGVSDAKTCAIMAALELGRRIASLAPEERAGVSCPQDAANLLAAEMSLLAQENLVALLLNTRNQVVARRTIYIGTVNSSTVRPAEVMRPAVRENAPSLIVAHNHPSGDPTPSPEDVAVTRDLVAAGRLLSIEVLDHLIIGSGGRFASLKEKGLGFDGK